MEENMFKDHTNVCNPVQKPYYGMTIRESLHALGAFKDRIAKITGVPVEELGEYLVAASPPHYYDTIRLINITRGDEAHFATIKLSHTYTGMTAEMIAMPAMPEGTRIARWGSIGEMPEARPRTIDLFMVVEVPA